MGNRTVVVRATEPSFAAAHGNSARRDRRPLEGRILPMYRRDGDKLVLVFLLADACVTAAAWMAAYLLRFSLFAAPDGVPQSWRMLAALPLLLLLAAISYHRSGLYEMHRLHAPARERGAVARGALLLFLLIIAVTFYRRDLYESRLALGLFLALNMAGLVLVRRALWWTVGRYRAAGAMPARALIVGSGRCARRVAGTLARHRWTGLKTLGFVDAPNCRAIGGLVQLGTLDDLARLVDEHHIDKVLVALPLERYGELEGIYRSLSELLVDVELVPDVPHLAGMRVRTLEVDRLAFVSLRANPHRGWHEAAKRGLDLVVGSAALLLLAPLLLLLAALVKWTSPGPVLFRQRRVGRGGRAFDMLKFRTMRVDAERQSGPVWAARHDERCTPLGRVLRRWSLDELPQLLNVLAGDMSLVGPRPERQVFIDQFRRHLPSYAQRHQVKTGITGWAQVNGWRGNTSLRRRLEYDLYYITNWSLALDLKILWMTVWRGWRQRHAY